MKIRTRVLLTFTIFGIIILIMAIFLVVTFQQVDRLNRQETIARRIEQTARELSYLSNDYLLNREEPQRMRWQTKIDEMNADLDQLLLEDSHQRLIVHQIKTNTLRLQSVFSDVSQKIEAAPPTGTQDADYLRLVQVSWSRLEVQNQNIVFNASLLAQRLLDQEDQLRQMSVMLIYVLAGVFAGYLLTTYFLIYKRVLRALIQLQSGTRIIGSGQLSYRMDDHRADEFGELSRAFDHMTENLLEIMASKADLEREIAERQLAEEALLASEARLRSLAEADIIGVFSRDRTGKVGYANGVFLNLIGETQQSLVKGRLNILRIVPEEDWEKEAEWMNAAGARPNPPQEKVYRRADGQRIPVLVGEAQVGEGPLAEWIGFVLDLTELKKAQASLAEYAEKLQSSNQELEQFAFIASHDLKEPLRKVRGFGDLLVRRLGDQLEEEPRDILARMQNAAERMQAMIDDLLELSRVGRRGNPFIPVSLSDLADEVLSDLEHRIQTAGGRVEIAPLPVIEADPIQMRQLLQNLVGNAIKYHQPEVPPVVHVWCQEGPGQNGSVSSVTLCVRDNGIGFDEEYLEKIFQPFTRLHGRSDYEGTGMGLAICKKIVERHHGAITASSIPGEGSTFLVTLPMKQAG